MTKYGYEFGSIAINQLRAWIDDKNYISNRLSKFIYIPYPQYVHFLILTIACQEEHNHL